MHIKLYPCILVVNCMFQRLKNLNQNGAQKGNVQSNDFWDNFGQKRTPSNSASMTSMSANNQVIF